MPRRNSADVAFFLIGGWDVLGTLTEFTDARTAMLERSDALGVGWEEQQYIGVRSAEITQTGFYDDAANSVHEALSTGPGVARVLCYGMAGTATGAEFEGWAAAMQVDYERMVSKDALHKARATYRTNGPVEHGRIVRSYAVHTATGQTTGTPVDNGASSTGGAAYLQYNATAGEANIRVLDSPDNITYSTLFTFAKTASGRGAERLTTTGAIQRYVAMQVTTASATGAITALNSFVGLVRGLTT